jgi:hypothetical protein
MNRILFCWICRLPLTLVLASAVGISKDNLPAVNFNYAFAPPHRITVALPDSSNKTLLDALPGKLEMSWTYEDLIYYSFKSFWTPPTKWKVVMQPQIDGHPFSQSKWERSEGYLPILRNSYHDNGGNLVLEIGGGDTAAIAKIRLANSSNHNETMTLRCEVPGGWTGYNPAWVDNEKAADHLLAGWQAPADQVVILGIGADENPLLGSTVLTMKWNLKPGESREAWLIRPYKNEESDVTALRKKNWEDEFERARKQWVDLLDRASRVLIPDQGVSKAFYACLADLFIMREPIAKGYIATIPGTEAYRAAPDPFETAIVAVALDQVGLHYLAELGYRVDLDLQEPDGDWTESKNWSHLMWGASGFKAWVVMEHYFLSGDAAFLERRYPQMLACSRWQEKQRARTRTSDANGQRALTYGLMPRGMGDAGLMDGDDLYGVFYAWNIWAVYADKLALEAARILNKTEDAKELEGIYSRGKNDLLVSLDRGAIAESDGTRWISAVPGKVTGSRYGVLNALFPTGLLSPSDKLIDGTLKHIERNMSPGGIPVHTGWMKDGMWVAIALDNFAEAHLARDEGDAAIKLLYATLNHGTPLYTWCEERGQEPNTEKTSGDRQHLWTPVAVVRFLRDALVMEEDDHLHLARGIDRSWLASGREVGIEDASTHFGRLTYHFSLDQAKSKLTGEIDFPESRISYKATLHCRLPENLKVVGVDKSSKASLAADGNALEWDNPHGTVHFEALVRPGR